MTVTRHAKALAQEMADQRRSAEKKEYRRKLLRLQTSFEPELRGAELAAGLGVERRELGRFLSESPRLRHARPDGQTRALIDAVLDGDLFIAVQDMVGGVDREVLICEARDIKLLASSYRVRNLSGGEVPEREIHEPADWDDNQLWDLFGSEGPETPSQPAVAMPASPSPAVAPSVTEAKVTAAQARAAKVAAAIVQGPTGGPAPEPPETRTFLEREIFPVGLGAMRLSTGVDGERLDHEDAASLIRQIVESGCGLIDTADAYALDADDMGHNERLIADALKDLKPEDRPLVVTKCGLTRPGGRWIPNGRPEHLRAVCEQSLENLGVESLDLLLLHVVDSKVPLAESYGALVELHKEGKARAVGLCNVKAEQLRDAWRILPPAAVQNPANFFDKAALQRKLGRNKKPAESVAEVCWELGIPLMAHSPIGGHAGVGRADRNKALKTVAQRHGVSPRQVALAWLLHMAPHVLPIPGATRLDSWTASREAAALRLTDEDWKVLDGGKQHWAAEARVHFWSTGWAARPEAAPKPEPVPTVDPSEGEVVLFVGPPAAGKTSRVQPFVDRDFLRLNRDELGGKLSDMVVHMGKALAEGRRHFVLDNTYPTRKSRHGVLDLAAQHGLSVRCIWIDTPVEEALYNACLRMLAKQDRILAPMEVLKLSKEDPNMLPPAAIFHYFQTFEAPDPDEGFADIERVPFERRPSPEFSRKALLLDYDGTLRRSTGPAPFPLKPEEVEILPGRKEVLDRYAADGWLLLGVSNQSAVGKKQLSREQVEACFARTNELLGHDIPVVYSPNMPHRSGVWDRKPMPGLGVQLIERHGLDRGRCLMVGDMDTDELFAKNCGFEYLDQAEFFAGD